MVGAFIKSRITKYHQGIYFLIDKTWRIEPSNRHQLVSFIEFSLTFRIKMGDDAGETQVEMWKVKKLIKSLQAGKYKAF